MCEEGTKPTGGVEPRLTVRKPNSVSPGGRPSGDTEFYLWRDKDGASVGRAYRAAGLHHVELDRVGRFSFSEEGDEVVVEPDPSVSRAVVEDTYRRWVLPVAVHVRGQEVLHASAVRAPQGVAAFCAASEAGKSTLAFALALRGYPLFADDAVAFEAGDGGIRALPLPFRVRLRPSSAAFFEATSSGAVAGLRRTDEPGPLAALFLLRRAGGAPAIAPADPVGSLPSLLEQSYHFGGEPAGRKRRMLASYLALTARTALFDLHMPDGLEHLGAIVDGIERALEGSRRAKEGR